MAENCLGLPLALRRRRAARRWVLRLADDELYDSFDVKREGAVPKRDEVQAVLDVLFLSKSINEEYELRMWHEAKRFSDVSPLGKLKGQKPKRLYEGWAKNRFDEQFRELVTFALEQAEKVRKGKKAIDIYPVNANIVEIQRDNWGVEFFLGAAGIELVDGFEDYHKLAGGRFTNRRIICERRAYRTGPRL
jgi:hypothetical protein